MEIKVENLTLKYGEAVAVDDLSLGIKSGELLVLLGPSGCGKTSTMRSVAGLETPFAGRISVGEQVVFDREEKVSIPAHKRQIGMVFQSYAIWPHKTVFQNVAFPLKMQKLDRTAIKDKVERTLALVGLDGLGERGASQLSGGQMQRVALARSIAMEPKVLLLDEPLSNLDARLRDLLRFELRFMQQQLRLTTIYVTHDQSEALALADRIAVMDQGKIVQMDTPVQLYRRPKNVFVADFLGVANLWASRQKGTTAGGHPIMTLGDTSLEIVSGDPLPSQTDASVCIRPENLQVLEQGSSPATINVWPGVVTVASFLGATTRYRIQLDGGPEVDVVSSKLDRIFAAGEQVTVHVPPDGVQLLTS